MVLLDNYFTLNKEQRKKFLSKEERKELRQEKRRRKQEQQKEEEQESEQESEQIEQETEAELKRKRKAEKKAKKAAKKAKKAAESESEEEEIEVKPKKQQKKEKKQQQESSSESEQQQYGDDVDAVAWRKEKEMTISGQGCEDKKFYPFTTFKHTSMPDSVMDFTKQFKEPSLIQAQSWPILVQGRDCIAIAETGSGKTLGFLLPAFTHILKTTNDISPAVNPRVLILSPTRELATQIHEVCEEAQKKCGIKSVCAYGGVSKADQKAMLKKGVQVVIGTPGRMKDLMQEGAINTSEVSMVVLDEADRMLDMGFKPDITYIFGQVKGKRQSVMFSATWPKEVQEVAENFIQNPVMIKIGTEEGTANKRVTQTVEVMKGFARNNRLEQLLRQYNVNNAKIIVFVLYKAEASRIEQFIAGKGHNVVGLHGDMSQKARNAAFQQFKDGSVNILVATDVAARGLDIPNVEHVINFSFPLTVSDYVHRIGRTGRAGKYGNSYTFFQPEQDKKLAGDLCQIMKEAGQNVPKELEAFGPTIHKKATHSMYGDHFKANVDMSKTGTKTKL